MTQTLADVLKNADALAPEEQMLLLAHLMRRSRHAPDAQQAGPARWSGLRGAASHPLAGEDAQTWVTRTRRDAQEQRGS